MEEQFFTAIQANFDLNLKKLLVLIFTKFFCVYVCVCDD